MGYFGYLAGAWFDWELIAAAARRRPSWRFYLIGYGGSPEGIELPATVELLGKQPQTDLAAFAANWDVAVIPFKPDRAGRGRRSDQDLRVPRHGAAGGGDRRLSAGGRRGVRHPRRGAEEFLREIGEAAQRREPRRPRPGAPSPPPAPGTTALGALLASLERGGSGWPRNALLFGGLPMKVLFVYKYLTLGGVEAVLRARLDGLER